MGEFIISIIKIVFGLLLLPLVVACVMALRMHLAVYPDVYQEFFLYGVVAFLLTFIFIYQFWGVYEFGQNLILQMMKILAPFDRLLSRFVPFYMTAIALLHFIVVTFIKAHNYDHYFLFFFGFVFGMHILLTAQVFQDEEKMLIKPSYFFWMPIIFVFNVFLVVVLFDLTALRLTIGTFLKSVLTIAKHVYLLRFGQMADLLEVTIP